MRYTKYLLPAIPAFFLLIFFLLPKLIKINAIECNTQYGACDRAFYDDFRKYQGKNLGEARSSISDFLGKNVLVSDFSFQFQLPNKLKISLVLRKAKFALFNENLDKYSLIDKDGFILAIVDATNLPYLIVSENLPNVGEKIDTKVFFSLEILYDMFYLYQVKEGSLKEDSLIFELPSGIQAVFPVEGDKAALVGALRLVIFRLNEGSEDLRIESVKTIDLRFKNPVLR